jgi:hypothetical protein
MSKTRMPSVKNVAAALESYKGRCDGECVDIRLQVYPADGFPFVGEWAIRFGDSSYDLDHNGYWGASCIDSETDCTDLAKDLIGQCADHAAQCGELIG